MEILQFDVNGKFAHFRKYYATNTALTFSIPPRTTIMGMLAGILGKQRDTYYDDLSSEKIRIGVALRSPIKKSFHRLNFLRIEKKLTETFESDFRGMGGHIQTPFEVVTGLDIKKDDVIYRFYISAKKSGEESFNLLKERLIRNDKPLMLEYNLTLGIAAFHAFIPIESIKLFSSTDSQQKQANKEDVIFHSAILSNKVNSLKFARETDTDFIEEELLPGDFKGNFNRELSRMNRVIFTHAGLPLKVNYSGEFFTLSSGNEIFNIAFLE